MIDERAEIAVDAPLTLTSWPQTWVHHNFSHASASASASEGVRLSMASNHEIHIDFSFELSAIGALGSFDLHSNR
jgi:hypothetical protein